MAFSDSMLMKLVCVIFEMRTRSLVLVPDVVLVINRPQRLNLLFFSGKCNGQGWRASVRNDNPPHVHTSPFFFIFFLKHYLPCSISFFLCFNSSVHLEVFTCDLNETTTILFVSDNERFSLLSIQYLHQDLISTVTFIVIIIIIDVIAINVHNINIFLYSAGNYTASCIYFRHDIHLANGHIFKVYGRVTLKLRFLSDHQS